MTTTISQVLVDALAVADNARPRSRQTTVGPSELGGCKAQVWHKLNATPPTNPNTLRLAAVMGTAIHSVIYDALQRSDPWGERFELEVEAEADGIRGHVDCYDKTTATVWDWKTVTKKKLAAFPSRQQRWQVHVYGWLLAQTGREVQRVGLVAIARDGNESDVVEVSEAYDEATALEAVAWLREVEAMTEAPAGERDAVSFCRNYCEWFGACPGKDAPTESPGEVLGEQDAATVHDYVTAKAAADEAAARVAALREELVGVSGVTGDGWRVAWSTRVSSLVDRDAVAAVMGEVPMKKGRESVTLTVKGK